VGTGRGGPGTFFPFPGYLKKLKPEEGRKYAKGKKYSNSFR
jgi:hypothetical protein